MSDYRRDIPDWQDRCADVAKVAFVLAVIGLVAWAVLAAAGVL